MRIAEIEKIGEKVIDWCIKVYGFSKFHGSVSQVLWVQYQSDEENSERRYGEYDSYGNIIYVYSKTNQTVGQIVHTILHEYRHYLQDLLGCIGINLNTSFLWVEHHPIHMSAWRKSLQKEIQNDV